MTTDGMVWRQLEQNFDRLLEQEEEMEAETIAPVRHRPQRPSTSKGNDQVRWLQKALNRVTRFGIAENGIPSIQTRKALQKFQAERGLRPTGALGPKTRAALIRLSGIPAPRPVERDDDDTLYEVEGFVGSCPADSPYVIREFSQYSDDLSRLPPEQQNKLAAIASEITRSRSGAPGITPVTQVIVVGHDDMDAAREKREPGFLQSLSERRAEAVGFDLECRAGTGNFDLIPSGRGARELAVPTPRTPPEHACNRRVEVVLVRPAEALPHLDQNQRIVADNRRSTMRTFYHVALQGTSGQWVSPRAERKAAEIAEKVVPFIESKVQESIRCGSLPSLWNDVMQPYFQDAIQGTASKNISADEVIKQAYEMARHSYLVERQAGRSLEWKNAPLPQPVAPDCDVVKGQVPTGPANHVLCGTHGHILDISAKMVIAHDLEEYKRLFRG
jgi:outer membrane protein OmpA-like peptidoglycan-associated protein